ncbi:MBL fold metallo-hydrolase [Spirosoma aerolatum]|uniref:MBL fold metallo-hydrolase n=1 Tax=Spirosoma aerolatum TaxID=1211326 RepID=UPI0009ABF973|nr:MBL fold metallo-hydrolase [Spirosoma aerolatum]
MRYSYVAIALLLSTGSLWAQTIANYQKAFSILQKAISTTGKDLPNSVLITSSGIIHNMGHYDVPEKTKDIPVEEVAAYFQQEQVAYLRSVIQNNGLSLIQSSVSKSDSVYTTGYYNRSLVRSNSQEFQYEAAKLLPIKLLQLAYTNRQSLRYLGEQDSHFLLSFSYNSNDAVTLCINTKTFLLDRIEKLGYNDRYGDVLFVSEYKGYTSTNGLQVPASRTDYEFGQVERELTYKDIRFNVKPDTSSLQLRWVPVTFQRKLPEVIQKAESLSVETIAPNLDLIKITSQNNKVLVAQFSDHIALFESPSGLGLNQQIIREIQSRYPQKPLRQVFLTHHHPDHAGGIRAFADLPVTFITTAGNEAYFKKLLSGTHTLNEFNKESGKSYRFDFVPAEGQKTYSDDQLTVVAYEIGKNTSHTAEHLVYYFPQQKLLWSGDLLFFRADGRIFPSGDRGKSVYNLITTKQLAVDKIYTSWPLNGQAPYGTIDDLRKSSEAK